MTEQASKPAEFWSDLERRVAERTEEVLYTSDRMREPLIAYLREVEALARAECNRRETIQVIASARRLLGDRSEVGPARGPFSQSLGMAL